MSIGTYAQLKDAIYKWLLRSSSDRVVTDAQVANYISMCESELRRELDVRELEDTAAKVTIAGTSFVSLPSDFSRPMTFEFDSAPYDISYETRKQLKENHGSGTGRPRAWTIHGTKIYFGPTPDAVYALTLDYYKKIPALSDSATTNAVLTAFPDVYLYGSLKQAGMQIKDTDSAGMWGQNYNAIIERIKEANRKSKMPSKLRMKPPSGRSIGGSS